MSSTIITINELTSEIISFIQDDLLLGAINSNPTMYQVCFDCNLWNSGYIFSDPDNPDSYEVIITPIRSSSLIILDKIIAVLNSQISDYCNKNFAYKSQVDRLLRLTLDLKNKLFAINCVDNCYDTHINALLLSTLIETMLQFVYILEVITTLLSYINTCGCLGSKVFEIFMGRFINSITSLAALMPDWQAIVVTYLQSSSTATQSYVASYVPKQPIHMPPQSVPQSHACVPCPPKPCIHPSPNNTCNC